MDRDPGIQLGHYLDDRPGTNVDVTCLTCMDQRILPMEKVVERLSEIGRNPRLVGIKEIGWMVKEPCRRCGGLTFESRPDYPPAPGAGDLFRK